MTLSDATVAVAVAGSVNKFRIRNEYSFNLILAFKEQQSFDKCVLPNKGWQARRASCGTHDFYSNFRRIFPFDILGSISGLSVTYVVRLFRRVVVRRSSLMHPDKTSHLIVRI